LRYNDFEKALQQAVAAQIVCFSAISREPSPALTGPVPACEYGLSDGEEYVAEQSDTVAPTKM
jgi:hypothetical protein